MLKKILPNLVCAILIFSMNSCSTMAKSKKVETIDSFYNNFINQIIEDLPENYDFRFSTLQFENTNKLSDSSSELGVYIAETLGSKIRMQIKESSLFERENLEKILEEQKLSTSGMIDIKEIKIIGNLAQINAIVMGSYTVVGENIRINARVTDVMTGEVLVAYYQNLVLNEEYTKLLNLNDVEKRSEEDLNQDFMVSEIENYSGVYDFTSVKPLITDIEGDTENKRGDDLVAVKILKDEETIILEISLADDNPNTNYWYQVNFIQNTEPFYFTDIGVHFKGNSWVTEIREHSMANGLENFKSIYIGKAYIQNGKIVAIVPINRIRTELEKRIKINSHIYNGFDHSDYSDDFLIQF